MKIWAFLYMLCIHVLIYVDSTARRPGHRLLAWDLQSEIFCVYFEFALASYCGSGKIPT